MLTARHAVACVVISLSSIAHAFDKATETLRKDLSPEGQYQIEVARYKAFNENSGVEVTWQDPSRPYGGRFKVVASLVNKSTNQPCRKFEHKAVKRDNRDSAVRTVELSCLKDNQWIKFDGAESALSVPEKTGPIGPYYQKAHPHVLNQNVLGNLVDYLKVSLKFYQQHYKTSEENHPDVISQMTRVTKENIEAKATKDGRRIAVDQASILLQIFKSEDLKLELLAALSPIIEKNLGDANLVINQFKSRQNKKRVIEILER